MGCIENMEIFDPSIHSFIVEILRNDLNAWGRPEYLFETLRDAGETYTDKEKNVIQCIIEYKADVREDNITHVIIELAEGHANEVIGVDNN